MVQRGYIGEIFSIYIRFIYVYSLMLLIGGAPTRKTANEIPSAPYSGGCRLLFNEFSLTSVLPYVEIARYCLDDLASIPTAIDMSKFAVILLDETNFVVGFCLLEGKHKTDGKWFYLLGTEEREKSNFLLRECQLLDKFIDGTTNLALGEELLGFLLIKNDRQTVLNKFNLLQSGGKYFRKKVTPDMERILLANLQDFYVAGYSAPETFPQSLGRYFDGYSQLNVHILHIAPEDSVLSSLSRCSTRLQRNVFSFPMKPEVFKIAKQTPGDFNECLDSSFREPVSKRPRLDEALPVLDVQPSYQNQFKFNVLDMDEFEHQLSFKTDFFSHECNHIQEEKIESLQQIPFDSLNTNFVLSPQVCNWIDYILPTKKLVCKFCSALLAQKIIYDRPGSSLITQIMKNGIGRIARTEQESGQVRYDNRKLLKDHEENILHQISVQYLTLYSSGKRKEELKTALEAKGGPYHTFYEAAGNVALATIQSVRMNLPFRGYQVFAETLDHFGANIGHLYRTPQGARMVTDIIGQKIHRDFMRYLNTNQPDVSITLDTTTDIAGYAIMGIIFQTFDHLGNIKVFLYRVMQLKNGEKGENLFMSFLESITLDGIQNYIKEKLIGLTTDGHPAVKNTFRKKLNEFVDNEVIGIWCGAHRLELIASKAFETSEYLQEIDEFINRMFRLLTAKSPMRREEFRKNIPEFGIRLFELKRVRKLRWLGHHVRALSPFIYRYPVIVLTLQSLAEDKKFNLKTRTEAKQLIRKIKDPIFLMTVAFLADVLSILAELSLLYQKEGDTLIGKKYKRDQLFQRFTNLEHNYGKHVTYILENSEFADPNLHVEEEDNLLHVFETFQMEFNGILLSDPADSDDDVGISESMRLYIDELLKQVKEYFPPDAVDNYDILLPSKLSKGNPNSYGTEELLELNRKFKWGYEEGQLVAEWLKLVTSLQNHPSFKDKIEMGPGDFWVYFLRINLDWSPLTTDIIRKALTIPSSSSQPERIFSIYSYVKSYRRYSLLPSTVENIIRIRFNGYNNIGDWNFIELGREIVNENHSRPDDKTRRKTWKKNIQDFNIEDEANLEELVEDSIAEQAVDGDDDVDVFMNF